MLISFGVDGSVDFYDLSLFTRDYLKDSNDPNTYSALTPKVNGENVLDGSRLREFQRDADKRFFGRKEQLYARKEREAA